MRGERGCRSQVSGRKFQVMHLWSEHSRSRPLIQFHDQTVPFPRGLTPSETASCRDLRPATCDRVVVILVPACYPTFTRVFPTE